MKDAFESLKDDHERVSEKFGEIRKTTSRSAMTRRALFQTLFSGLELHIEIEESLVHPVLGEKDPTRESTLQALETHQLVKDLLDEAQDMRPESQEWMARITELERVFTRHAQEEEAGFPQARTALSSDELTVMSRQIADRKRLAAFVSERLTAWDPPAGKTRSFERFSEILDSTRWRIRRVPLLPQEDGPAGPHRIRISPAEPERAGWA